jgi:hypothetical protein
MMYRQDDREALPKNTSRRPRKARRATTQRNAGRRSSYARCPSCRKIRQKYRNTGEWMTLEVQRHDHGESQLVWPKTPFGRVCRICAEHAGNYKGFHMEGDLAVPVYG